MSGAKFAQRRSYCAQVCLLPTCAVALISASFGTLPQRSTFDSCNDAGHDQDDLSGLTPRDSAGWILLGLQFQKLHVNMATLDLGTLVSRPELRAILAAALSVANFGDVQAVCGSPATEGDAAAQGFTRAIHGQRKGLVELVGRTLASVHVLEEEEGLPRKIGLLSPNDIATCALLLLSFRCFNSGALSLRDRTEITM